MQLIQVVPVWASMYKIFTHEAFIIKTGQSLFLYRLCVNPVIVRTERLKANEFVFPMQCCYIILTSQLGSRRLLDALALTMVLRLTEVVKLGAKTASLRNGHSIGLILELTDDLLVLRAVQ